MKQNMAKKRFEMRGHDERDLQSRLQILREAIRARGGSVLDLRWHRTEGARQTVTVIYTVPVLPHPEQPATLLEARLLV